MAEATSPGIATRYVVRCTFCTAPAARIADVKERLRTKKQKRRNKSSTSLPPHVLGDQKGFGPTIVALTEQHGFGPQALGHEARPLFVLAAQAHLHFPGAGQHRFDGEAMAAEEQRPHAKAV